jgi:hypothetical protein
MHDRPNVIARLNGAQFILNLIDGFPFGRAKRMPAHHVIFGKAGIVLNGALIIALSSLVFATIFPAIVLVFRVIEGAL